MTVELNPINNTEQTASYDIKPVYLTFTDWRNHEKRTNPTDDATIVSQPRRRKGNKTHFHPQEASDEILAGTSKQERLYWQDKHNRDVWWGYRIDVDLSSRADVDTKMQIMKTLGAQLEMNMRLVCKATSQLFSIDVPETGHPTAVVGFCLYVHLFNTATEAYEERTQSLYVFVSTPGLTQ